MSEANIQGDRLRPGQVITFYSYKGGVGRSMTLANLAILLSHKGFKILMVDFDLEAPGLHRYFDKWLPASEQRIGKGVLPFLKAISDGGKPSMDEHILQLHLGYSPILGGRFELIHLLPSGIGSPNYANDLQGFSWSKFIANLDGASIIDGWRSEWLDPHPSTGEPKYDFVLVDSRTGLTDHGSVCTILLPDVLALCFAANEQNLQGVKAVAQSVQATRASFHRPQLTLLPLLTKFDGNDEFDEGQNWLTRISKELKFCYANWLPTTIDARRMLVLTKLPYVSKFSFGEPLPVLLQGIDDPASIGHALSIIADLLGSHFKSVEDEEKASPNYLEPRVHARLATGGLVPSSMAVLADTRFKSDASLPYCPNCRNLLSSNNKSWICLQTLPAQSDDPPWVSGDDKTAFADDYTGGNPYQHEDAICETFNPEGERCVKCQSHRDKTKSVNACPVCQYELPNLGDIVAGGLTITGPAGSGKTSYLVALNQWWKMHSGSHNLSVTSAMTNRRVLAQFDSLSRSIIENKRALNPTPPGKTISYSWLIRSLRGPTPGILFSFTDVSGESLWDPRRVIATRYYEHANGVIFLIDGGRLLDTSSFLANEDNVAVAHAMISDLRRRNIDFQRIPFAVCINKIDLFSSRMPEWSSVTRDYCPNHEAEFDFVTCHQRSIKIRELIYKTPQLVPIARLFEAHFENLMFFPTATVSSDGDQVLFSPLNVEDPFLYLLWNLGFI